MNIYFRTKKLQKIATNHKQAQKDLGLEMALKLHQRLNELSVADNLSQISKLKPTRCHELKGRDKGVFAVDLKQPFRLLFIVASENHFTDDGQYDLQKITEIEIIEIRDYH